MLLKHREKKLGPTDYLRSTESMVGAFCSQYQAEPDLAIKAVWELCESVKSPYAYRMMWHLHYACTPQIPEMDKASYWDKSVECFRLDFQIQEALSKYTGLYGLDASQRRGKALQTFSEFELHCKRFNVNRPSRIKIPAGGVDWVYLVQRKLGQMLENFYVDPDDFGWGSGATASIKRADASFMSKVRDYKGQIPLVCSRLITEFANWRFLSAYFDLDPDKVSREVVLWNAGSTIDAAVIDTVPKNAKTDRTIAIEPTFRMLIQKAIGLGLRRCLSRVGVNLEDQGRNQALAELALDFDLATIDLRAASDTVSRSLVYDLVPMDVLQLLDAARSKVYVYRDSAGKIIPETHRFEKFSTMGNGFTFELETCIFFACAKVAAELTVEDTSDVSAYGDDLIVPQASAPLLIDMLTQLGFVVNTAKSYTAGLYFESCGEHFFKGAAVKPFYQKEVLTNVETVYRMANRIRRAAYSNGLDSIPHPGFYRCWSRVTRGLDFARCHTKPLGVEGDCALDLPWWRLRQLRTVRGSRVQGGYYWLGCIRSSKARPVPDNKWVASYLWFLSAEQRVLMPHHQSLVGSSKDSLRDFALVLDEEPPAVQPNGSTEGRPKNKWFWDDRYFESLW